MTRLSHCQALCLIFLWLTCTLTHAKANSLRRTSNSADPPKETPTAPLTVNHFHCHNGDAPTDTGTTLQTFIAARLDSLQANLSMSAVGQKHDDVEVKLTNLDKKLDTFGSQQETVETMLSAVHQKQETLDTKFYDLDKKLDIFESKLSDVVNCQDYFETNHSRFVDFETQLHILENKLNNLSNAFQTKVDTLQTKMNILSSVESQLGTIDTKLNSLLDIKKDMAAVVNRVSDVELQLDAFNPPFRVKSCDDLCDLQLISNCTKPRQTVTWPDGTRVLCDTQTSGGGWTIFQRRFDGSLDFYLNWSDYVNGFGSPGGEYWLGLRHLYHLVSKGRYELRVDMKFEGEAYYAVYSSFNLSSPSSNYVITVGEYSGTAGDSLAYHNGMAFFTYDRDSRGSCAKSYKGAWWYHTCHRSHLNGLWGSKEDSKGLIWVKLTGYDKSVTFSEMKVRKKN